MLPERELHRVLAEIDTVSVPGPFFRSVAFKYLAGAGRTVPNVLSGVPARDRGGRYNAAAGFLTTYLAESADTALIEGNRAFLGSGVAGALPRPLVILSIRGQLARVLDLLDPSVRARVGSDEADLVAPYLLDALNGETVTQRLGRVAYESGRFEAVRGPSAQRLGGHTIAVFPERIATPSRLELVDPDGILRETLPRS